MHSGSTSALDSQRKVPAPADSERVLQIEGLSVSFGDTVVLKGLNLSVARGTSLAIIGPNGTGKTVLLRALLGSIPYRGVIRWARDTRIGYVPQKLDVDRDIPITGEDFLSARLSLAHLPDSDLAPLYDLVGLTSVIAKNPLGALSGGQFQRLLLAFALLGQPNVLLLDEPTAGMDEPGQEQINQLLHRLQSEQRLTILFISHDLSVVYHHADQVLCLSRNQPYLGEPRRILAPEVLEEVYGMPLAYHIHDS